MFNKKIGLISAIAVCLILCISMISLAQNEGNADPAEELSFEVIKTHIGDVLDIKIADIDGDNISDIIFGGLMAPDLHIMYGIKEGGYTMPQQYEALANTIAFGYFNNDNYIDIVSGYFSNMYVCINNGDRTFTITNYEHESANLGGVATGYFNDDSHMDIVAAFDNIYYGDGTGNFPVSETLPFSFQSVFVSDYNNDEIDDLIAISIPGNAGIYLNDGYGSFTKSADFDLDYLTLGVSIDNPFADFNRDGNADFAFITPIGSPASSSKITVGYGDGLGGILSTTELLVPKTAYCLAIADANRDYNLDLIASNASDGIMNVFLGDGNGLFSDEYLVDFYTDSVVHAIATGDLDRDGNPDFVAGAFGGDNIILVINTMADAMVLEEPMITTGYSNVGIDIINPAGFELSQDYKTVAGANYWRQDIDRDNSVDERAIDYNLQYGEYEITINPKQNVTTGSKFSTTVNIGSDEMVFFKDYDLSAGSRALTEPFVFYYTVEASSSMQPANGSSAASETPSFDWSGLVEHNPGVTSYQFEIDRYYDFQAPIVSESNLDMPQYTVEVPLTENEVYYWRFRTFDGVDWSEYSRTMAVQIVEYVCGDIDGIAGINILDVVYIINYKYKGGPAPEPIESGDVDGIPPINILDAVYLINSIYKDGPAPVCVD